MFPIRDHNPSGRTPYVTYGLILANVGIFLAYWLPYDAALAPRVFFDWGVIPLRLLQTGDWFTAFTSMFLHGGWMHLIGNMLFLWIYGDNMEDVLGPVRFLLFYLASGLAAVALQVGADPGSIVPMVGASGAIAGVMGGYLLLFPKARIDIFFFFIVFFRIIPVRAWIVLGIWLALQIFGGFSVPTDRGGVAYFAHLGGFAGGLLMTVPVWLARGGTAFWNVTQGTPPHPAAGYGPSRIPKVPRR